MGSPYQGAAVASWLKRQKSLGAGDCGFAASLQQPHPKQRFRYVAHFGEGCEKSIARVRERERFVVIRIIARGLREKSKRRRRAGVVVLDGRGPRDGVAGSMFGSDGRIAAPGAAEALR